MRRHTLATMIVLLCAAFGAGHTALAQRSGWTSPIELSPPRPADESSVPKEQRYGSSWFPDIAAAPDKTVFVTWFSGKALPGNERGSVDLLMYRELREGRWSEVSEVIAPAENGMTVRNSIVVARDGRLHAVYRSGTSIVHASAPLESARLATSWSAATKLSGFGAAYYTALATDSKGNLHAFYSEAVTDEAGETNTICPGCSDLFYRRSSDGGATWSSPINLSGTQEGENRPQVKVDQFDRIHVVWDEGIDWYAGKGEPRAGVYRRSDDGGLTWTEPVTFHLPTSAVNQLRRASEVANAAAGRPTPTPVGAPTAVPGAPATNGPRHLDAVSQTSLGLDGQGNPIVVFRGAYLARLYSAASTDGGHTWEEPTELPGLVARPSDLDIYSMATDGAGIVHLLVPAYLSGSNLNDSFAPVGLWHLTWSGHSWVGREAVMNNELYPEYPKLIVTGGNQLHAVWFTRSRQDLYKSDSGRYRVWYSSRLTGAPDVAALPLFTPTPATTAAALVEPTPLPTPTPTRLPAEIAALPPVAGKPAWEGPGMALIALALAPVVLLLGGMLFLLALRRRG